MTEPKPSADQTYGLDTAQLLQEYDLKSPSLHRYAERLRDLVHVCLQDAGISVHSINTRVKERTSLQRKLEKKGGDGRYQTLADLTDVVGLRIITHFGDEVDRVAGVIHSQFAVDAKNTIDTRTGHAPDRFGYLSLHYIVGLSAARLALTEYREFKEMKAEVQIRTILQHSWAEIEHDLGYKVRGATPTAIRRRFSRLAGLLELADSEFMAIREDVRNYELSVKAQLTTDPGAIEIDQNSVGVYLKDMSQVTRLDQRIAEGLKAEIEDDPGFMFRLATCLQAAGFHSLKDVDTELTAKAEQVVALATQWANRNSKRLSSGACLWYLGYWHVAAQQNIAQTVAFLATIKVGRDANREALAKRLISLTRTLLEPDPVGRG